MKFNQIVILFVTVVIKINFSLSFLTGVDMNIKNMNENETNTTKLEMGVAGPIASTKTSHIADAVEHSVDYHQRLLEGVMNNLLGGIVTINTDGIMLTVNQSMENLTGYSSDELIGSNLTMLMSDHIAKLHGNYLKNFIQTKDDVVGKKRYLKVYRKDGDYFLAEIAVSKMHLDGEIVFIGSIYDVTEQVRQQDKIWELARFPEESWNPVMKISNDGIINYANEPSAPLIKVWGASVSMQVPDEIVDIVKTCILDGVTSELVMETDPDTYYKLLFAPVPDLKSVYLYGVDISQTVKDNKELEFHRNLLEEKVKIRTEEAIKASEEAERANQAKSLFLANMSHEIRTPLTSIIGYAEFLMEKGLSEEEYNKAAVTIIRSGLHLKDIISDVLDLSKIEADKLELDRDAVNYFDMFADIQSLMNKMAIEKRLIFDIDYRFPLPKTIYTDAIRLKQIVLNLCSNAIKFTHSGSVTIKICYLKDPGRLQISVHDTGIGLSPLQVKKIFKPFEQADKTTTREYGGTGLGLSLSKRLAEMLGGDLQVSSELDSGSEFGFSIPVVDEGAIEFVSEVYSQNKIEYMSNISMNDKISGSILLVEDTPALQQLVRKYLERFGLTVSLATNGKEALDMVRTATYDVILMDIQMPVMDGYMAICKLRADGYTKPVLALTANAMSDDRRNCFDAGFDDVLTKPIQSGQLFSVLSTLLQKQTGIDIEENADNDVGNVTTDVLLSGLLETDPDMYEIVEMFLDVLPGYIEQIKTAENKHDWKSMAMIFHVLKGMGGSYGYDIISDLATEAENALEKTEYQKINVLVDKLVDINERAQSGYKLMRV